MVLAQLVYYISFSPLSSVCTQLMGTHGACLEAREMEMGWANLHALSMREKKRLRLPGVEPGSIAWKAIILTVGLQTLLCYLGLQTLNCHYNSRSSNVC